MLKNKHILVTRPLPLGQELVEMIENKGGSAFLWPCIDILKVQSEALQKTIAVIDKDTLLVFVSPNAARMLFQALPESLREKIRKMSLYAIGEATANVLSDFLCHCIIYPKGAANSEAFLSLASLQNVVNKKVVICRAEKGRELIAETLLARGAKVNYLNSYQRRAPICDPQKLIKVWQSKDFDLIVLTSIESLVNLEKMLGENRHLLQKTPITVMSERMATLARKMGIIHMHYLESSRNQDVLTFLEKHDKS